MIGIIDYGSGNLHAIANIYRRLKIEYLVTSNLAELEAADRYVLPGVGAFDATMDRLRNSGLAEILSEQVLSNKKKLLGICVGMQVLGDSSEEGSTPGLGWISSRARKIDTTVLAGPLKLPHMGWNSISPLGHAGLFESVNINKGFYFLHKYYLDVVESSDVAATVVYGKKFPCAVSRGNIFGVQFHPEKSHSNGAALFKRFSELK